MVPAQQMSPIQSVMLRSVASLMATLYGRAGSAITWSALVRLAAVIALPSAYSRHCLVRQCLQMVFSAEPGHELDFTAQQEG